MTEHHDLPKTCPFYGSQLRREPGASLGPGRLPAESKMVVDHDWCTHRSTPLTQHQSKRRAFRTPGVKLGCDGEKCRCVIPARRGGYAPANDQAVLER